MSDDVISAFAACMDGAMADKYSNNDDVITNHVIIVDGLRVQLIAQRVV